MQASHTKTIIDNASLRRLALSVSVAESERDTAVVLLGPQKSRAAHSGQILLELSDYSLLSQVIHVFPKVVAVLCRGILYKPYDLLRALPPSADYAHAYVVTPSSPAAMHGRTAQLALPRDAFLSAVRLPVATGTHLPPTSDVRLINLNAIPLPHTDRGWLKPVEHLEGSCREVVLHARTPDTFTAAGEFLAVVGAYVEDLTVRYCDPLSLSGANVNELCQTLGIWSCTSLAALTLCYTLARDADAAANVQRLLNLALLRSVPAPLVRRVRLAVIVTGHGLCASTRSQVKQLGWRDIGAVLHRFPALQEVAIAVMEEGSGGSEVWQEIERSLRVVMPKGVRLMYRQGCIL